MIKNLTKLIDNEKDTLEFAAKIGAKLKGGETIELISDLGGGKTTFVKGLAKGVGSTNLVTSPSFTLQNEYQAKALTIHHLDFYRLEDPGIMSQMLTETIDDTSDVTVIEWAGIIEDILPSIRLKIEIKVIGQTRRKLTLTVPDKLSYLVED